MTTTLLAIGLVATVIAAMSVGVLFGRRPIQGSCGGLGAVGLKGDCEVCGGDPNRCKRTTRDHEGETHADSR